MKSVLDVLAEVDELLSRADDLMRDAYQQEPHLGCEGSREALYRIAQGNLRNLEDLHVLEMCWVPAEVAE